MRREGLLLLPEEKQWPSVQQGQILAQNLLQEKLAEDSSRQEGDVLGQGRQLIVQRDGGQVLVQHVQDVGQGGQIQVQEGHTAGQRELLIGQGVQNLLQEGQYSNQKLQTPAQDAKEVDALIQIGQSGKEVCNLIQKEFISQLSKEQERMEPGSSSNNQATMSNSSFKQQHCTERNNHKQSKTDDKNNQNDTVENIPDVTLAKSTRKQYACTFCNKKFNSENNVDYHKAFQHPIVVTHINDEKTTYSCRLCLERFDVRKR